MTPKLSHRSTVAILALVVASCESSGGPGEGDGWAVDVPSEPAGEVPADVAPDGSGAWVVITAPEEGSEVDNPVTFTWDAGPAVRTVALECEGWPLHAGTLPVEQERHVYDFSGVDFVRHVTLTGFDEMGEVVATDEVSFTPLSRPCSLDDQPGFNHYTVMAINDTERFPRDGTFPYCWEYYGDTCGDMWGQIHDGYYGGTLIFGGGGDCFCSGHTLEIFLHAFRLWREGEGLGESTLFEHMGSVLSVDDVDIGDFYQRWQGFGVASTASAADAFELAGIGENLHEDRWDEALPGDYVNLSRSTGSGHAVIFAGWVWEGSERVGLRYYGCNGSGQSCPDPDDPENTWGNSGPSFVTEYFEGYGGSVLPSYLFIGRVWLPVSS